MTELDELARASAVWTLGVAEIELVARSAADALGAGYDSPALRDLAGRAGSENRFEMLDLIATTFDELRVPYPDPESDATKLLAMAYLCECYLSGGCTVTELSEFAHACIGHEGPAAAQPLVELDDLSEQGYSRSTVQAMARERARAFLAGFAPPVD